MSLSVRPGPSFPTRADSPIAAEPLPTPHAGDGESGNTARPLAATAWSLAAYLAAITCAELVTVWQPVTGMLVHTALLLVILVHASLLQDAPTRNLVLALALAPLTRILSLAMPLGIFPQLSWYAIISAPLFVAIAVIARQVGVHRRELNLTLSLSPVQWLIASIGVPLGVLEYAILRPEPLAASPSWRDLWLPALILLVCTGLLEELLFRGLLQRLAAPILGPWGFVFSSAIFAALHIGHRSVIDVGFVFLVALLFADFVARTHSLTGVTIAHGLTNSMLFLVCPFLLGG
jgi:membrane protease YdiL (CAAX protease family)